MDRIVLCEMSGEFLQVAALHGEVQLAEQSAAELANHPAGLIRPNLLRVLFRQLGQPRYNVEVRQNLVGDACVLNLDHDLLARVQPGAMDLGNRSRGERHVVEFGE